MIWMTHTLKSAVAAMMLAAAILTGGAGAYATPAHGARVCNLHSKIATTLTQRFKEHRVAVGYVSVKGIVEVYVSEQGTWTMVFTTPKGISCIMASGTAWEKLPVPVRGVDS